MRPTYGFRHLLLDSKEKEPQIQTRLDSTPSLDNDEDDNILYGNRVSMSLQCQPINFHPAADFLDQEQGRSWVKDRTQYLGSILIIDAHHSSGIQSLDEFINGAKVLDCGSSRTSDEQGKSGGHYDDGAASATTSPPSSSSSSSQFNIIHAPVHVVFISNANAMDSALITKVEVQNKLLDAGFHNCHFIPIQPSPTRQLDASVQDFSMLGNVLYNGPAVSAEALMEKIEWDRFIAPILKQMYQLQYAAPQK